MSDFGHEMFHILSIDKSKMFVFQVFGLARLSNLKLVKTTAESRGQIERQMWYKQRKVLSGCLDKFTLGWSQGYSDLPKGKSEYPRDHPWVNFSRQPLRTFRYFSEFSRDATNLTSSHSCNKFMSTCAGAARRFGACKSDTILYIWRNITAPSPQLSQS